MSSDNESKLKQVYSNIKNFFILDVQSFVRDLNINMDKPTSIYLINDEIEKLIVSQAKLKKFKGIIYINKHLSADLYYSFKQKFSKKDQVKIVLIDNGQFPKHQDIMDVFDEVIFYERFKKSKIVECTGFEKNDNNVVNHIIMEETDE